MNNEAIIKKIRKLHRMLDDNTTNYNWNQAVLCMGDHLVTLEEEVSDIDA